MDSDKLAACIGRKPFVDWPLNQRFVPDSRNWHYDREDLAEGGNQILKQLYPSPSGADFG